MRHRLITSRKVFFLLLVGAILSIPTAATVAQNIGSFDPADNSGAAPTGGPLPDPADAGQPPPDPDGGKGEKQEPPPSLPGSHAAPTQVAPRDKAATDMNPTAALFDAINRGDTVAARDALSRGADPEARNVLGLTPIDESVDLGRNDISFLLLSVRTSAIVSSAPAGTPLEPGRRSSLVSVAPHRGHGSPLAGSAQPPVAASGAAAPSSGFLGFGNGS